MKKSLVVVLCFVLSACSWFHPQYSSGLEGQALPDFPLMQEDSINPFSTTSIASGKPFILFLYQPSCTYCQAEMTEMLNNFTALHNVSVYLVTTHSFQSIRQFSNYYNLNRYSTIHSVRDSSGLLLDYFKAPVVPYLAFYDSHKKLLKVLPGKSSISSIKDIIADQTVGYLAGKPLLGDR